MPVSVNFEIYKKNPGYTDAFVKKQLELKQATFVNHRVPNCAIVDCIPDIIFKGILTKQPAIYS